MRAGDVRPSLSARLKNTVALWRDRALVNLMARWPGKAAVGFRPAE
jgi:hypothetical protein